MSAPTPVEHGSSPPSQETIHTAVGISIAFFVLTVIGIWHIGRKSGSFRSSRRRRAIPTRRPQSVIGLDGSLGQSAVDKIPMIKVTSSATCHVAISSTQRASTLGSVSDRALARYGMLQTPFKTPHEHRQD